MSTTLQKAKGQKQRRINHDYSRFWKHEITLKLQAEPVYPQKEIRGDSTIINTSGHPFMLGLSFSPSRHSIQIHSQPPSRLFRS